MAGEGTSHRAKRKSETLLDGREPKRRTSDQAIESLDDGAATTICDATRPPSTDRAQSDQGTPLPEGDGGDGKRATRHDEEMAASALVSMFDDSLHEEEISSSADGPSPSGERRTSNTANKKALIKSKNKTITSLCYECGTEQTSHFRPVVSDFVSQSQQTIDLAC